MDFGCTSPVTLHRDWFSDNQFSKSGAVFMGKNAECKVVGITQCISTIEGQSYSGKSVKRVLNLFAFVPI